MPVRPPYHYRLRESSRREAVNLFPGTVASLDEEAASGAPRGLPGRGWSLAPWLRTPTCQVWPAAETGANPTRPHPACVSAPPGLLGPLAPPSSLCGRVLSGYPPPIPMLGTGASRGQRSCLSTSVFALLRAVGGGDLESPGWREGGVRKVPRGGRPRTVLDPGLALGAGVSCPLSQSVRSVGTPGSRIPPSSFAPGRSWRWAGRPRAPRAGCWPPPSPAQLPDATLSQGRRQRWTGGHERTHSLQPGKARNRQKVKIPFVNKIELFDCETRVRGI